MTYLTQGISIHRVGNGHHRVWTISVMWPEVVLVYVCACLLPESVIRTDRSDVTSAGTGSETCKMFHFPPPPFWLAFGLVNAAMTVTKSTQFNIGSWNCHWIVVWIEKWVSLPSSFTSSFMEAWLLRDLLLFELFSTKKLIFQFREPVTWLLVSQRLTSNRQLHHELSTHKFDTSFNQLTSTTNLTRIHFESTR